MAEPLRYPRPAVLDRVPEDGHVVIEASAGTGKTHTLEHLVVDLVLTGRASIDEILIVTFTEPATAELKARVRSKFEDLVRLSDHGCTEDEPHWLIRAEERRIIQAQLDMFGRSSIHTIHGFCHRVLLENAFHLRRLFDEEHTDSATIFDMAFKRALREDYATDPELRSYLLAWLEDDDLPSLGRALAGLVTEDARLEPAFSENTLRKALSNLGRLTSEETARLRAGFHGSVSKAVYSDWVVDKLMKLVDDLLRAVPRFAEDDDLASLLASIDNQLNFLLKGSRYTDNMFQHFGEVTPRAGTAQVSLHAALVRLIPLRAAVLHKLVGPVREALTKVKAEGWFDYDDMLLGVWDRMKDPDDPDGRVLVNFLRRRFKVALIDEFQDTDPVQWNIFRRVFYESGEDGQENRLFVIGDPKQAIYGFRGADVHTYLEAKDAILSARGETEPVRLSENFRSTPALVAAYNRIFDQRAPSPFFDGPIRYDAPVVCGRPGTRIVEDDAELTPIRFIHLLPKGDKLDAYSLKRTLGRWIASEIARLLSSNVQVIDDETGESRKIGPKDIYVLARSGSEARRIGKYLRAVNVPFAFYKEEGLFQTAEARHVLELLVAVADPYTRSNRFTAWATPFFSISFEDLARCRELPETHPLMAMLLDWHEWANRGEFERLFSDVLDRTGIVRREIFRGPSERELTNYMHIFEILLEEVHRERAGLSDLIVKLRAFIDQSGYPQSADRNIQRLETDKAAVQVMTVHKSKGLQADVVFIYGGMSAAPAADRYRVCHQADERVLYMGLPQSSAAMQTVAKEAREEDQRLLYVAVTRARALVYLPYVATLDGELQYTKLDGTYKVMNDRLLQIAADDMERKAMVGSPGEERPALLFEMCEANAEHYEMAEGVIHMPPAATYSEWTPPDLMATDLTEELAALRGRSLIVSSYSRMKRTSEYLDGGGNKEAFMREVSARAEAFRQSDELPGGTDTGIFLHDILELVSFDTARDTTYEEWIARPDIDELFVTSMKTHGIEDRYADYSRRLVWSTITTGFELPNCEPLAALYDVPRDLREVEFLFPIPEPNNPAIDVAPPPEVTFDVKRGYLKGFIDLLFEHDGKVFFADWKSDSLDHYDGPELEAHVRAHYENQAWLYAIATLKMFGIHDEASFDERFGGFMYAFLRGIDGTPNRGFYLHRPELSEIKAYERKLQGTTFR